MTRVVVLSDAEAVAQSAAASFNPAHKLIDQHTEAPVQHNVSSKAEATADGIELYRRLRLFSRRPKKVAPSE